MSSLYAFLNADPIIETKEVFVSKRFKDENGNIQPFKIRTLTLEENNKIINMCRKFRKENGVNAEYLDNIELSRRLIVESVVEPDFKSKELCEHFGVLDPLLVPEKMLRSGECNKLMAAIKELAEDSSQIDEVKNA